MIRIWGINFFAQVESMRSNLESESASAAGKYLTNGGRGKGESAFCIHNRIYRWSIIDDDSTTDAANAADTVGISGKRI